MRSLSPTRAFRICICFYLFFFFTSSLKGQSPGRVISVVDAAGDPIANARLIVHSPLGAMVRESVTDREGKHLFADLPSGTYLLKVEAASFQARQISLEISPSETQPIRIELSIGAFRNEITITANRGAPLAIEDSAPVVDVRDRDDFQSRPLATIGNALENSAGVMVQQSAYGQVSPFLRGLTGYQVLNLIDGVRFNNATFRSGPNQYLAFIEPGQMQRIEAMLGPASSQYGSDALGGAIQLLSPSPDFGSGTRPLINGEVQAFGASADASSGTNVKVSLGAQRFAWLVGGDWRKHNDLRAGGGNDSHHVFRRFFGLSEELIRSLYGNRQQDTGFTQYGWHTKMAVRLEPTQNLTLRYQGSRLDDVRGYKDLWGGLGRLRSDFDPQGLHFFYARYEKLKLGFLDSLSGTFSINSQSDGSIRQGLRETDRITRDESLVDAFGYAAQAISHIGKRQAIVFGGEFYGEGIDAFRRETDPRVGVSSERRALYPNGSRYATLGLFAQDSLDIVRGKLRASLGGRLTRVRFQTFANRNRDSSGNSLGVIDSSQKFRDFTYNASLSWQLTSEFALHVLVGRGFRAPNLNDLGALGLNDLGYEIPAQAAVDPGGLIGVSDGESVASSGRKVAPLIAEKLINYEFGATMRARRLYVRAQAFDAESKDPIVRRTLLFPAGSVPTSLAGVTVSPIAQTAAQLAQNVVGVATPLDPRAVKAFVNEGQAKYYGFETIFRYAISSHWFAEGNYSFITGRELNPNRYVRRLPPQQGFAALRFQPGGKLWVELSGSFSGAQERLSGGDVTDERIGAARSRRDITDFFQGALVRPFIRSGTGDDIFATTNETIAQIRDRVLPIGSTINGVKIADDATRAPLYIKTAGFATINLRSGIAISENVSVRLALMNLLDRNYRVHGSGLDTPGVNLYVGLRFSF